jgi:hypothetical protein
VGHTYQSPPRFLGRGAALLPRLPLPQCRTLVLRHLLNAKPLAAARDHPLSPLRGRAPLAIRCCPHASPLFLLRATSPSEKPRAQAPPGSPYILSTPTVGALSGAKDLKPRSRHCRDIFFPPWWEQSLRRLLVIPTMPNPLPVSSGCRAHRWPPRVTGAQPPQRTAAAPDCTSTSTWPASPVSSRPCKVAQHVTPCPPHAHGDDLSPPHRPARHRELCRYLRRGCGD